MNYRNMRNDRTDHTAETKSSPWEERKKPDHCKQGNKRKGTAESIETSRI